MKRQIQFIQTGGHFGDRKIEGFSKEFIKVDYGTAIRPPSLPV